MYSVPGFKVFDEYDPRTQSWLSSVLLRLVLVVVLRSPFAGGDPTPTSSPPKSPYCFCWSTIHADATEIFLFLSVITLVFFTWPSSNCFCWSYACVVISKALSLLLLPDHDKRPQCMVSKFLLLLSLLAGFQVPDAPVDPQLMSPPPGLSFCRCWFTIHVLYVLENTYTRTFALPGKGERKVSHEYGLKKKKYFEEKIQMLEAKIEIYLEKI